MCRPPEVFDEDDRTREQHTPDSERPSALTPLLELVRGDCYRCASLDFVDLDPPTTLPPHPVN